MMGGNDNNDSNRNELMTSAKDGDTINEEEEDPMDKILDAVQTFVVKEKSNVDNIVPHLHRRPRDCREGGNNDDDGSATKGPMEAFLEDVDDGDGSSSPIALLPESGK